MMYATFIDMLKEHKMVLKTALINTYTQHIFLSDCK